MKYQYCYEFVDIIYFAYNSDNLKTKDKYLRRNIYFPCIKIFIVEELFLHAMFFPIVSGLAERYWNIGLGNFFSNLHEKKQVLEILSFKAL